MIATRFQSSTDEASNCLEQMRPAKLILTILVEGGQNGETTDRGDGALSLARRVAVLKGLFQPLGKGKMKR